MNKTKILAFVALGAILSACGSDNGSPPSLKSTQIGLFSPFDTLKVEFDSEIVNISELNESNIEFSTDMERIQDGKKSSKILYFKGSNSTPGGLSHFASNLINATITFKELKNSDGYIRDSTTLSFSTYQILDDLAGNNDTLKRAIDLESHFSNSKTVSFVGVLDHKIGASKFNMEDYYKISMRMNDTLIISAKSNDTLTINIIEPGRNSVNKNFGVSPKKENKHDTLIIGSGHLNLNDPDEPASKPADFYIKVYDDKSSAPPNPYTLSVSRLR